MIKDILNSNEEILPNTKQIEVLKENFPACFNADGSFDIERFKEYLSDKLMVSNEGYELKFLGKNYARLLASIDTTTVIVPDEEHNNKPENKDSQNIYISGDNLDGLKQLLKSYAHQVKCIYIDPPYNTGSDGFVYNDNFNFSAEELSTKLSIDEEQAQRILDLTKRGSASHSAWLMFMYPRLLLARDLLTDDGVIFISIDDNECHNLKLLCDDVFGEENFIAEFPRITKRGGKSSDIIAKNHDYFLMYSKGVKPNLYAIEHNDAAFKYSDDFFGERGFYKLNQTLDYDSLQYSSSLDYPLEIEGETFYPGQSEQLYKERQNGNHDVADWAWRWSREKFKFGCENGFIVRYERSKAPLGATALTYADGTVRSEISQGRIGTKIVPGTPSGKYLYDSYAYDSPLEKDNIIADIDEVIVYGKIPRASIAIPTITGGMYSPDFMYVVKHKNGHKELNIIVETKDVENKTDLRGTEKAKIECAKVFFNMLTADGYTVHFRDQLGNKQMAQIISEVMRGEN